AEARRPADAEAGLEQGPTMFKGFAYEGAGMALSMLDALPGGGRRHVAQFLQGRADLHGYMVYGGVGWAMAPPPRVSWSTRYAGDPVLRWLTLDGYGFHQAYFRTRRYVHEKLRHDAFPWPGDSPAWYPARVIDQGVGRAMWFVAGTDVERLHTMVQRFA